MTGYLADTTVLVEHLRGNEEAREFLETHSPYISTVSKAELIQGSRNSTELKIAKKLYPSLMEMPISNKICELAINLMEKYFLNHGLLFLDAVIAATAMVNNLTLVTGNTKHFIFIPKINILSWGDWKSSLNPE